MIGFKEKYVNPFTDYGFKRLFGEEYNKDLLLDFLNELLKEQHGPIKRIQYLKTEQLGAGQLDRRAVFDLYCESSSGEKFIVEIQKAKQNFFKDRSLFYSTFPIREQAQRDDWNFCLNAVYTVAILDFVFDEDKATPEKFRYDIKLSDIDTHKVFYEKLTFIYLEMPKFTKTVEELETRFEKWLYVLKNLHRLDRIPDKFREKIFKKLFASAEIAHFTPEEITRYEDSLKIYRDIQNTLDTARAEGEAKGKAEGKAEVARNLLSEGLSIETVVRTTGLSLEEVKALYPKKVQEEPAKFKPIPPPLKRKPRPKTSNE